MRTTNRPPGEVAIRKGNVAQSSRHVKDKRLRRAFGILDPS